MVGWVRACVRACARACVRVHVWETTTRQAIKRAEYEGTQKLLAEGYGKVAVGKAMALKHFDVDKARDWLDIHHPSRKKDYTPEYVVCELLCALSSDVHHAHHHAHAHTAVVHVGGGGGGGAAARFACCRCVATLNEASHAQQHACSVVPKLGLGVPLRRH